jgi:hypothetical protein
LILSANPSPINNAIAVDEVEDVVEALGIRAAGIEIDQFNYDN